MGIRPVTAAKTQIQRGGTAFSPAFNAAAQNTTGFDILMWVRAGVASNPGQNGHVYLEISPDNATWQTVDYVACRNNQAAGVGGAGTVAADAGAMIGMGRALFAHVPAGWWYRLRTQIITNYAAPTFILDGATPGYFSTIS